MPTEGPSWVWGKRNESRGQRQKWGDGSRTETEAKSKAPAPFKGFPLSS